MKNKKTHIKISRRSPNNLRIKIIWLLGSFIALSILGFTLYSTYSDIPLIANVKDDYKYNLTQQAAGVIPKNVRDSKPTKSAGQIQAEAQLTLKEIAKENPTVENIKISNNANRPENKKNISKKDQDAAEEVINTQNTTIVNDAAQLAKAAADRKAAADKAAADKLAAEQAAAALALSAPAPSANGSTCITNGAPVELGTWVATGEVFDSTATSSDFAKGRKCVQCGADGRYSGSIRCSEAIAQGKPVVLPTNAGTAYTGAIDPMSSCYEKVNGILVQVPVGQIRGKNICSPDGNLIKKEDISPSNQIILNSVCGAGRKWDNGVCKDMSPEEVCKSKISSGYKLEWKNGNCSEIAAGSSGQGPADLSPIPSDAEKNLARISTPYTSSGCEKNKKDGEKCVVSSDNPQLYMIVSSDWKEGDKVKSGVLPSTISSEIKKPPTADTTFKGEKECFDALVSFTSESSCEPIAGGMYYKIVAKKDLPAPQRDYVKYVFGSDTPSDSATEEILTSDQKSNLEDPSKEWSKDNPLIVDDWMDCPDNKNYEILYRTSTREKTQYECGLPENVITANPVEADDLAREATEATIKAGESCVTNRSCESNDCRWIKNEEGKRDYYCMSTEIEVINPDGWDNGIICSPNKPDRCKSGYCSDNIFNNTCETNPFSGLQISNSSPNTNNQDSLAGKPAGELCGGYNADSSCQSGECKMGIPPGGTEKDWYCMTTSNTFTEDVIAPDGTLKGKNGTYCLGRNDMCASNFCEINTGVILFGTRDKCADNPFTINNQQTPSSTELGRVTEQLVTSPFSMTDINYIGGESAPINPESSLPKKSEQEYKDSLGKPCSTPDNKSYLVGNRRCNLGCTDEGKTVESCYDVISFAPSERYCKDNKVVDSKGATISSCSNGCQDGFCLQDILNDKCSNNGEVKPNGNHQYAYCDKSSGTWLPFAKNRQFIFTDFCPNSFRSAYLTSAVPIQSAIADFKDQPVYVDCGGQGSQGGMAHPGEVGGITFQCDPVKYANDPDACPSTVIHEMMHLWALDRTNGRTADVGGFNAAIGCSRYDDGLYEYRSETVVDDAKYGHIKLDNHGFAVSDTDCTQAFALSNNHYIYNSCYEKENYPVQYNWLKDNVYDGVEFCENSAEVAADQKISNENIKVEMQNGNTTPMPGARGTPIMAAGCGPLTVYNFLVATNKISASETSLQKVLSDYSTYWSCKAGDQYCYSSIDSVAETLKKYNVAPGAIHQDTSFLSNYSGMLTFGGKVTGPNTNIPHLTAMKCDNGSCCMLDSAYGGGICNQCEVVDSNNILCGGYNYHVGNTQGVPDTLQEYPNL